LGWQPLQEGLKKASLPGSLNQIPETQGVGTGEDLILLPSSLEASAKKSSVNLVEAEIVLSKGGRSGTEGGNQAATIAVFSVKQLASVEFTYSVLGCSLQLIFNNITGEVYGPKQTSKEATEVQEGSQNLFFLSPEGEQFQKLFLAIRQLLDICL
jgi:hypothetical protein